MTTKHHPGFWVGVFLFLAGLILFIIGFSAPYWLSFSVSSAGNKTEIYLGLWLTCGRTVTSTSDDRKCSSTDVDKTAEFMKATQALQCLALAGFALVCALLLADICSAAFRRRFRRSIEIVAFISAVLGLLGAAVFGGMSLSVASNLGLDWAIAVNIAGLLLIVISAGVFALVFAICNKKRPLPDLAKDNPAYLPPEYDQRRMTDSDMRRMAQDYEQRRPAPNFEPMRMTQVDYRRDYPYDRLYVREYDRRSASMDDLAAIPHRGVNPGLKAPYIVPYGPPIASRAYAYY